MTREEVVKVVVDRLSRLNLTRIDWDAILRVVGEKYPRANYASDHDYRFGPADVLELEREMRRRLRV